MVVVECNAFGADMIDIFNYSNGFLSLFCSFFPPRSSQWQECCNTLPYNCKFRHNNNKASNITQCFKNLYIYQFLCDSMAFSTVTLKFVRLHTTFMSDVFISIVKCVCGTVWQQQSILWRQQCFMQICVYEEKGKGEVLGKLLWVNK